MTNNNLKLYRQKQGLTQAQLAKIANIGERHYQRIEHGETLPNVMIAQRLAKAFGTETTTNELFPDPLLEQEVNDKIASAPNEPSKQAQ